MFYFLWIYMYFVTFVWTNSIEKSFSTCMSFMECIGSILLYTYFYVWYDSHDYDTCIDMTVYDGIQKAGMKDWESFSRLQSFALPRFASLCLALPRFASLWAIWMELLRLSKERERVLVRPLAGREVYQPVVLLARKTESKVVGFEETWWNSCLDVGRWEKWGN